MTENNRNQNTSHQPIKQKAPLFSPRNLLYDFVRITAAPGLLWFRPKPLYENDAAKQRIRGSALIISNHLGFHDPMYLLMGLWYRRQSFVCRKEFFESKAAWFFRGVRCIPVDTENPGLDLIRNVTERLKNGEVVTIFPEGHINDGSGEMAQFKSGMVLMAMRAKAPIIPVYIRQKRHWYERLTFAVGEPIDIEKLYGERPNFSQIEEAAAMLFRKESELKDLAESR